MQATIDHVDDQANQTTDDEAAALGRHWGMNPERRWEQALARVRRQQLQLALAGEVVASAQYAQRANRIRSLGQRMGLVAVMTAAMWAVGATVARAQPGTPATVVRAEPVREETVRQHQRVTGTLRAVSRAAVAAQEEGAVVRVLVDEGDAVREGQVIAELDTRRITAQLEEARAEAAAAGAQIAEREAELIRDRRDARRLADLLAQNVANQREHDDAQTAVDVGAARLESARRRDEQARQRVALLQIRLQDMQILAPFAGRVVRRHVEPGVWVNAGDAVATIVSSGRIEAELEVPQRLAEAVSRHAEQVSVMTDSDRGARPALALRPVPQVDSRVRTFSLIAELDNQDGALYPGMSVSAWVPAGEQAQRTTVPKDAVVRTAQGTLVYRAAPEGRGDPVAQPVQVKVLFETADRAVVESGTLAAGDLVVVEGNERLRPSTPLVLATN